MATRINVTEYEYHGTTSTGRPSEKFWRVTTCMEQDWALYQWGKIGSKPQCSFVPLLNMSEVRKKQSEKLGKGYSQILEKDFIVNLPGNPQGPGGESELNSFIQRVVRSGVLEPETPVQDDDDLDELDVISVEDITMGVEGHLEMLVEASEELIGKVRKDPFKHAPMVKTMRESSKVQSKRLGTLKDNLAILDLMLAEAAEREA